jgi:hypothetical protein
MIVESISSKSVKTKFGDKPAYSIKCNGQWYQFGFKRPAFAEGDNIDFDFEETSYGNKIKEGTVTILGKGAADDPKAPAAATTPSSSVGRSYSPPTRPFPIPALHGDRAIVRQNSLTNAVKLFTDCVPKDDLAVRGPLDYTDIIIDIARKFEAYSTGTLDEELVRKAMKGDE